MKEVLDGNTRWARYRERNCSGGFSTLEIIIALALMMIVIGGAMNASFVTGYWTLTSETGAEALYKAKALVEELRAVSGSNFQGAQTTDLVVSLDPTDPSDASCLIGGLCYSTRKKVIDISSCAKYGEGYVTWRVAPRYPQATESLSSYFTNYDEVVALGGDCARTLPKESWLLSTPITLSTDTFIPPLFQTGLDVLERHLYVTSGSAPQLRIFSIPSGIGSNPTLSGSLTGSSRLNAIDVVRDFGTGKVIAFATQHTAAAQLAVFDVTDPANPVLASERALSGVQSTGSFPEGWRVFSYKDRVYVTTRETSGPELHIFNTTTMTAPSEIVSARRELNRTVNDLIVREQMIGGVLHRYLFLAASAGLKELAIFDVSGDTPSEVVVVNLPGTVDARSMYIVGNRLYIGRAQHTSGPELFVFDIPRLLSGDTAPLGTSEVGASVETIRGSGDMLVLGTGKSGEELQVWKNDLSVWDAIHKNTGRVSFVNVPRLAPLGIDFGGDWLYLVSQSASQPELLQIVYTP